MSDPLSTLRETIEEAASELAGDGAGEPRLEQPPTPDLGDYSTNAAMMLAKAAGRPPREVAERLREGLAKRLGHAAKRIEVAGPGFINLFLGDGWYRDAVSGILAAGDSFGAGTATPPERVLLEFVSANPTGPITVAAGRHAAYGDSLGRILGFQGHTVEREYLLNDVGGQVQRFAASIAARMRGEEPPEDGYAGEYVVELARDLAGDGADPYELDDLARRGTEAMRRRIEASLERFGVRYDTWFSERTLHEGGKVDAAIAELRDRGHVYEQEDAVWLRTAVFGDDKDRVLVRSGGEPTYFAADVAYHRDKLERGAERLLAPLGADHYGYVARMRAAIEALGADPEGYEAPIIQLVHIIERGGRAQMSKRKGEFVTLDELVDDIGVDASRFFLLQRSHDTPLDLDLDLARERSQENPVYYVQYAHARIASILRKAVGEGRASAGESPGGVDEAAISAVAGGDTAVDASTEPSERALVRRLLELRGEVAAAGARRAPHRLGAYAGATAADFHAFYRDCQVVGAGDGLEQARLGLCLAARRVIARTLDLLGVGAPQRM